MNEEVYDNVSRASDSRVYGSVVLVKSRVVTMSAWLFTRCTLARACAVASRPCRKSL